MTEFDVIAYAMLGVSSSISAVQIARWLLNANPRVIIHAGRWSLVALVVLTPVVLLWLLMSGRSTLAMMLAAFILPAFVHGGLHWRQLFSPLLNFRWRNLPRREPDFGASIVPGGPTRLDPVERDLVRQSIAVLTAYLEQGVGQGHRQLTRVNVADTTVNGTAVNGTAVNGTAVNGAALNGARSRAAPGRMSAEKALHVLGLTPAAGPQEISEAHHRLQQKLKPELGDTHYLTMKIDEARNVLLLEE
jgi:hypothetical protein